MFLPILQKNLIRPGRLSCRIVLPRYAFLHSHSDHSHSHDTNDDHDHVHLKSSETEQNDEIHFGVKGKHFEYYNGSSNESSTLAGVKAKSVKTSDPIDHTTSHSLSHTHGPGHSHSSELFRDLTYSKVIKNPGARITILGLVTNIGMAVAKGGGGLMFHSQALLADAIHSVSDLISDFLTLFTISFSLKPSNETYPNGYGKIESIGSLSVSSLLLVAGVSVGYSSLTAIIGPLIPAEIISTIHHYQELFHIHPSSHGHSHVHGTDINAAWIAAGSIVVKEWLFQATKKIAVAQNSNVLLANAWHHRVDSLTSIVALVTITSGVYFQVNWLDAFGGLLVSGLIVKAGYSGVKLSIQELIDKAIPVTSDRYINIKTDINEVLGKITSNNNSRRPYAIEHLSLLSSGPNYIVNNLVLRTPKQKWDNVLTINEFENVARVVKEELFEKNPSLKKISVEFVEEE